MRLLVCGGRDYNAKPFLFGTLDAYHTIEPISVIIHGAALGADMLAQSWADKRGIETIQFPAKWDRDGKAAGPIRNRKMLTDGSPTLVMAFPGGRGTADMVKQAHRAGIPVRII